MTSENLPARATGPAEVAMVHEASMELSVDQVIQRVQKVQEITKKVMKEGTHFGRIPGAGDRLVLLKPGAQILLTTFMLAPSFEVRQEWDGPHLTVTSICTLRHIPTGNIVGSATAMCSTREAKYGYRAAARKCPQCGAEAIIKGKAEYGGGWICFGRKGGCGAKFTDDDAAITGQTTGRVDNPDLADTYNTVVKMSNKRAMNDAILNATSASDIFTQDVEEQLVEGVQGSGAAGEHAPAATRPTAEAMKPRAKSKGPPIHKSEPAYVEVKVVGVQERQAGAAGKIFWVIVCESQDNAENFDGTTFSETIANTARHCMDNKTTAMAEIQHCSQGEKKWVAITNLDEIEPEAANGQPRKDIPF